MVSVSSLCVGKELLIGKTVNTNASWIGGRLFSIGTMLDRVLTVTDSLPEIESGLGELLSRHPDFIVVVGGLGPTPDDMTLRGVSRALGSRLRVDQGALTLIKEHYEMIGRKFEMTPARRKMATIPEGSLALPNDMGTAPGVRIEHQGTVIFCLPGVPREMKSIYKGSVEPELRKKVGRLYTSKVVMHLTGIFESTLSPVISAALRAHSSAYIKSHPKGIKEGKSNVELDIVVISTVKARAQRETEQIGDFFRTRVKQAGGSILRESSSTTGR